MYAPEGEEDDGLDDEELGQGRDVLELVLELVVELHDMKKSTSQMPVHRPIWRCSSL